MTVLFPVPGGPVTKYGLALAWASSTTASHSAWFVANLPFLARSSCLQIALSSRRCSRLSSIPRNMGSSSPSANPKSTKAACIPASSALSKTPLTNCSTKARWTRTMARKVSTLSLPVAASSNSARMASSSSQCSGHCWIAFANCLYCGGTCTELKQ